MSFRWKFWFLRGTAGLMLGALSLPLSAQVKVDVDAQPLPRAIPERAQNAREAAENARDRARENRELNQEARDLARDKAQNAREAERQARDRNERGSGGSSASRNNDRARNSIANLRGADIGVWFNRSNRENLVISDVSSRGAFAKFGFNEGDRIVSVGGQAVATEADFIRYILARDTRDKKVNVVVVRNGQEQTVSVEPSIIVQEYRYVDNDPSEHFGVILDDRYDDRLVVWRVVPRSPAYYAGVRAGDVLVNYDGKRFTSRKEFQEAVRSQKAGNVAIQVERDQKKRDFEVEIPVFQPRTERDFDYDGDGDRDRDDVRGDVRGERRDTAVDDRETPRRSGVKSSEDITPRATPRPDVK